MNAAFTICLLFSKSLAQIDGEFWWLNPKLDKFRERPPQPKFEDLSEFETDQSAKIVFREDDPLYKEEKLADLKVDRDKLEKVNQAITFQDKSEFAWIDYTKQAIRVTPTPPVQEKQSNNESKPSNNDIFQLKFPDDTNILINKYPKPNETDKPAIVENYNHENNNTGKITYLTSVVPIKVHKNVAAESESICTFMKKHECNRIGGVVYVKHKSDWKQEPFETGLVCCILPLRPELKSSKIYFLDTPRPCKRCKRSEVTNTGLNQRNALLLRKFGSQTNKLKLKRPESLMRPDSLTRPDPTKTSHKVVTPSDDYLDPYWNIKNNRKPSKQGNKYKQTTNTEYEDEYVEDYVFEIPQPGGLPGLYSDHGPAKPGWNFPGTRPNYGVFDSDEVDEEAGFGYSPTVDPRLDRRPPIPPLIKGRPVKLSYADNRNYDAESQTITYQSNPDFQVLQGFKLLNLVQNKSRVHRNRKTTTERLLNSNSNEHILTASPESTYDDDGALDASQVYKECGKVTKGSNRDFDDKEIGDAEKGSHPSLALVVLTKRKQSFLCYGTIIHPRAAVTVADCVFGRTDPGEISVIAGAWRLDEESREEWQKRMATIHVHSEYKPGKLENNLALLHWKRPLRLAANVQPACLSSPHVGDSCRFFGWGGYDQAIRKQSRWQRAVVLAPRTCEERVKSKRLPAEAFCAAVQTRGSVTGIGGPLLCSVSGRQAVSGVAVWRDLAVVLLPAHDWVQVTLDELQLTEED
ncbi:trypsin domain-containing protein [Phthorimaea operculella]|nr:trypsin domain-containing protein [Phthorimaea operculella]